MPILVIFCLLWTVSAIGVVFNLDFNIYHKYNKQKNGLDFSVPVAQADEATTTVSVLNASPYFSVGPFEKPFSTSTSPVNVGENVTFTAKALDPELNDYYLLVCGDATGQANNGGAPTCSGETLCVSGSTVQGASTTCSYTVIDPGAETDVWYAYVCDAHATEAACSAVNQGTGDGGSPFYVNHAPTITALLTSDDNKAPPYGVFTVSATSTDTDVLGGSDEIYFDFCATNQWSTTTRCAVPLCYATSTISGGVTATSCQFTIAQIVPDQDYVYYLFVQDWHNLGGSNNPATTTYTVINVAPIVSGVIINESNDIDPNLKGAIEVTVTSAGTVQDYNGCTDLSDATSTIYWESVTGAENCTADDNNCYKITTVNCTQDAGTCTGNTDPEADYTCTTQIAFYAVPTDGSADASTTVWRAALAISDDNGAFHIATSVAGVDVTTNTALDVVESGINYGTMSAGANTGNDNATTTVVNYGNSPLDAGIYGTDMTDSPYYIRATYQEYSLDPFVWGGGTDLSSTTVPTYAILDVVIGRPTSQTNVTDQVLWGLGLPVTTHSGDYTGTTTFVAIIDENGAW